MIQTTTDSYQLRLTKTVLNKFNLIWRQLINYQNDIFAIQK